MSETLTLNERVDEAVRSLNELFNPYGGKIRLFKEVELPFIQLALDEAGQLLFHIRFKVSETDTPDQIGDTFLSQIKLKINLTRPLINFMDKGVMCDAAWESYPTLHCC